MFWTQIQLFGKTTKLNQHEERTGLFGSKKTKTETITKAKNVLYTQKSSLRFSHNNSKT